MKLEDQVCSLETAKLLKKLGVKQDSQLYWNQTVTKQKWKVFDKKYLQYFHKDSEERYSAFTVAELGEMLPIGYRSYYYDGHPSGGTWMCNDNEILGVADAKTEADARAKMRIRLIKNELIEEKRGET